MTTELTPAQLINHYIQIKEKKAALDADHKARSAPFAEAMQKIEDRLQQMLEAQGLQNFKSEAGCAYKATQTSVTVDDWDTFLQYVQEHDLWHLLERRASKKAVEEILEATSDLPPGITLNRRLIVNIRKD